MLSIFRASVAAAATLALSSAAFAEEWMLRVETSSRACHVQLKTASKLGEDFKGPFASRKDACKEAAAQYDGTKEDMTKCGTYGEGTIKGCAKDKVSLPPK